MSDNGDTTTDPSTPLHDSDRSHGARSRIRDLPASTACRRCRKQKLKCSRDQPICKRCQGVSAICQYPPPPDRKLLAAQRLRNASSRAEQGFVLAAKHSRQQKAPSNDKGWTIDYSTSGHGQHQPLSRAAAAPADLSVHAEHQTSCLSETSPDASTFPIPPPEIAAFLFEVYFARLYNASLLFHKRTFLADYAANKVPDFVALSIFALASIFLHPSHKPVEDGNDSGLEAFAASLGNLTIQGHEWATMGSQRVLMQADVPRLETIQACQNLALYWFAAGRTDRTHVHAHTAYKVARLLAFHEHSDHGNQAGASSITDELKKRCFWSCWATSCISQTNACFKSDPWKEAVGLRFPSDEISWAAGNPISHGYFDGTGEVVSATSSVPEHQREPSIMAEFLKLYGLWWEIQHFIKLKDENNQPTVSAQKLPQFFDLDRRLNSVFDNLHPHLQYINSNLSPSQNGDPYKLFSLHNLYHLCACTLHSSIVPLFSDMPNSAKISKRIVSLSVQDSIRHAMILLDMATVFMGARLDVSRLPSITGYAMFVAAAIHFKSLVSQRKFKSQNIGRFKAALFILHELKKYWTTLQDQWDNLSSLFSTQGVHIGTLCSARTNWSMPKGNEDETIDIEKIILDKGTPKGGISPQIYTYITDEEVKSTQHKSRPSMGRHGSNINDVAVGRRLESRINAPTGDTIIVDPRDSPPHSIHTPGMSTPNTYQHYPTPHETYPSQPLMNPSIDQPYNLANIQGVHHNEYGRITPGPTEDTLRRQPPPGQEYFSEMQAQIGYLYNNFTTNVPVNRDEGEVWWDQSFDMEMIQPSLRMDANVYPTTMFPFG
ncbi:hypothetical protein F5884DRAFT_258528 [Xylogone sp. PMI_703]|nr:hypothetical protein F5884DRAFT_258528 [Xylogone sp. PMI_703]